MGWTFFKTTKEALVQHLIAPQESSQARRDTLAHTLCDNVLWSVVQITAKEEGFLNLSSGESLQVIYCDLLESSGGEWGYKSLEESCHPYYYSCPLAYLDRTPVQCQAWRDDVLQYHLIHA